MLWDKVKKLHSRSGYAWLGYAESGLVYFEKCFFWVIFAKYELRGWEDAVWTFCNWNSSVPDSITAQLAGYHIFINIYNLIKDKLKTLKFNVTQNGPQILLWVSFLLFILCVCNGFYAFVGQLCDTLSSVEVKTYKSTIFFFLINFLNRLYCY